MLRITIFKRCGLICGFEVKNHTDPIVCSAVSALSQCTVNAVEALTDIGDNYIVETDEDTGLLYFWIPSHAEGKSDPKAELLLEAFELSAKSVKESYSEYINVKIREVSTHVKN